MIKTFYVHLESKNVRHEKDFGFRFGNEQHRLGGSE